MPLLPALAIALFGLHVNIRTLGNLENTYYFNKWRLDTMTSQILTGSERPPHSEGLLNMLFTLFNGLYSIVGSLNVSMTAALAVTRLIREKDLVKQFPEFVDAIDSETRGQIEAAARKKVRIGQRQQISTAAMQTAIALHAHDANTKQAEVLIATREATAASTRTLGAVQELLVGTQELNRKTEECSRNEADYGRLVLFITFATFVA
jgi:Zn finger protein HypA/HybF involved in hydrogenase expression